MGKWVLLTALLIAFNSWAAPSDVSLLTSPAACLEVLKKPKVWDRYNKEVWGRIDPMQGADKLKEVLAINKWLLARPRSFNELVKAGIVEIDVTTPVIAHGQEGKQPYYIMRLPKIFTGLYFPNLGLSPEQALIDPSHGFYQNRDKYTDFNINIAGIGTNFSVAIGMAPIAGTFTNIHEYKAYMGDTTNGKTVTKKSKKLQIEKIGYRAYSVMLDATFNGLGEEIPFAFASNVGTVAMIRHAQLVLKNIFEWNRFNIMGRSQGGHFARYYATIYGEEDGLQKVVACNPTSPNLESLKWTQFVTLKAEEHGVLGDGMTSHPRSWLVHNYYSQEFSTKGRKSKVPVLVLHSPDDVMSYPQELYTRELSDWQMQDLDHNFIQVYDNLDPEHSHNLFDRTQEARYESVVKRLVHFFQHGF